jgi:hypothetical protein
MAGRARMSKMAKHRLRVGYGEARKFERKEMEFRLIPIVGANS